MQDIDKHVIHQGLEVLQRECGRISREHGFWVNKDSVDRLLMLMVGELSEAHEELRSGKAPNVVYFEPTTVGDKPCGFVSELADCVIRIFDAAEQLNLGLPEVLVSKMIYNEARPFMHGKKF